MLVNIGNMRRVGMMQWIRDVADFCYPHRCARCECQTAVPFLCGPCDLELHNLERRAACDRCAMPLGGPGGACPYCDGKGPPFFDRVVALGTYFDPLRHLIYAAKYHGRWTVAEQLADRLIRQEAVKGLLSDVDCLVAVPLHRMRQITRGYNQAEVIAKRLSRHCGKRVIHPVVRLRNTKTQLHMSSRTKREENLKDAFGLVNERSIRGRHVVIVDDVTTTGATLRSVARTLQYGEPASLCAIVLATGDPLGQSFQVI